MSDKFALSDVFTNPSKKGTFPPKGGLACPFPSREKRPFASRAR